MAEISFQHLEKLAKSLDYYLVRSLLRPPLEPYFFTFLRYAVKLSSHSQLQEFFLQLKRLDESTSKCLKESNDKCRREFVYAYRSLIQELKEEFFAAPKLQYLSLSYSAPKRNELAARFIEFLVETLGDLLDSSDLLLSWDRVNLFHEELELKLFHEELKLLFVFQCNEIEKTVDILTEIEAVANEAGIFLYSFFFTRDPMTKMDPELSLLLSKLKMVKAKIKNHCNSVLKLPSSTTGSTGMGDDIVVGLGDEEISIASQLVGGPNHLQIISIFGMPGLGKTTLAKKLYNNSSVLHHFHKRSWCVVSHTYEKRKLLIDILSSISDLMTAAISNMDEEHLCENIYKNLKGIRYLIVLDDIWKVEAWDDFKRYFPDDRKGSRVLFTSRHKDVALQASSNSIINEIPFISDDECWELLKLKVFQKQGCPEELQDAGKKIVKNCQRLPLAIVVIAAILANMEKKESLWEEVARSTSSYISAYPNKYTKILELSYNHLPLYLKPCFLYLSSFMEDAEISVKNLLPLWIAEGFIHKKEEKGFEDVAEKYLMDLINRSLVQVTKRRFDGGVKVLILHDLIREMCLEMAKEENFLKVNECESACSLSGAFYSPKSSWKSHRVLILTENLNPNSEFIHSRYLRLPEVPSELGRLGNLEFLLAERADFVPPVVLECLG